ncbi:MAG: hypothetical protein P0Y53_20630 [Candidatus Pseudobacter hemicellulosilyticus]|uniref:YD repeat-containing protein n=1 Tax=Candidatus Pseudobacter hemicellulosilyticus TaxID=3121375 RepID=A0AAJ5WMY1_9BACT|nr:MAG: hypothetical protein P0Y53_20630 [Pseudobacter sp.]
MKKYCIIASLLFNGMVSAQVNLQTGAAEANFPLFTYEDPNSRLSTAIGLQYVYGNGLKVNEFPANVGVGWNLEAGGVITRLQFGEPDDQKVYNSYLEDNVATMIVAPQYQLIHPDNADTHYPGGYMYTSKSAANSKPRVLALSPYMPSGEGAAYKILAEDREQDRYVFQFNDRKGAFVIGKDKVPVILNDSRLKISFEETDMTASRVRTRISSFVITDEQGIEYTFNELEFTELLKYKPTTDATTSFKVYKGEAFTFYQINNKIVTKWYLSKIRNPLNNAVITFRYDDYSLNVVGPYAASQQSVSTNDGTRTSRTAIARKIVTASKRLRLIEMPGNKKVGFNYRQEDRVDLPGDKALNSIIVYHDNTQLYGYQFEYGYMYRKSIVSTNYAFPSENEKRYVRLCLKGLQKIGTGALMLPPHLFSYHLPTSSAYQKDIPLFTIFSDHFGYFNGDIAGVNETAAGIPTQVGPKTVGYAVQWPDVGVLKEIQFPEGGKLTYEYELNTDESSSYQQKYAGGVRVASTIQYDGEDHSKDIIKKYRYVKEDGTSSGWGFEPAIYTENKKMRHTKKGNSDVEGSSANQLGTSFATEMLRARSISMANGTLQGAAFPGGGPVLFQMMAIDILTQLFNLIFNSQTSYVEYDATTYRSDNICLSNPLPFQYSRVEVVDEIYANGVLTGTNGKVVYQFVDPDYFPLRSSGSFTPPYSAARQRYAHWAYGLPRFVTWFNAAGQPVRKVENQYNIVQREIVNANNICGSYWVNTNLLTTYRRDNVYIDLQDAFLTAETYYPLQGRSELTKTIETMYKGNGQAVTAETDYTYSPNNFSVRTISKQDSKGDITGSTTYYVADYEAAGTLDAMKKANILNVPLSVNTWKRKTGQTDNTLTKAVVTEYMKTANGDFKPVQIYQSRLASPLAATIANAANFDALNLKGYSYLKPVSAIRYIGELPVEQVSNEGGATSCNLYDYNNKLVVAQAVNARVNEIRYTSFEADNKGGWSYPAVGVSASGYFRTGSKCYDLGVGGPIVTSLEMDNKPIVISVWATGTQLTVQTPGTVAPAHIGPTINGWTYYEFQIPDIGQITTLSVQGNGLIDELRLYPARSTMTTYTHQPGIGITSQTDQNSRTIYHRYDTFGREIEVRDEYFNLIKAYQYNFKQ